GGGMSSRLFQNIRERQGLAYAIYSDLNPYRDTGGLSVYAGTSRESAAKVVQSIVSEFKKLKSEPVPDEELRRSKDQLKGSLMLSLESSTARMSNLARQDMYFDRFYSMDELIEKIEAVTAKDLQEMANDFFRTESIAVTVLGHLDKLKISRDQLACYNISDLAERYFPDTSSRNFRHAQTSHVCPGNLGNQNRLTGE